MFMFLMSYTKVIGAQPLRAAYVSKVYLDNDCLHYTYRFSTLSAAYVC